MKRITKDSAVLLGLTFVATALIACPAALDDRCSEGACLKISRDGNTSQDADPPDASVDPCLSNPTEPKCVNDETKATFVSGTNGDDGAALGTKAKPFKTLAAALGKLTKDKRRIYVCDGDYPEDVVLDATHVGVSLFGGLTCDWQTSANKPKFGKSQMALKISGTSGVAIADLAFEAKDAVEPGGSSIAAFVRNGEVTFKRVALAAGKGVNGADGTYEEFTFPADLKGNDGADGGAAKIVPCPDGSETTGGKGGPSGVSGEPGKPGQFFNAGTTSVCSGPGSVDTNGKDGTPPAAASGAKSHGDLTNDGWQPSAGGNGDDGAPGQGGGGGYGSSGGTSTGGGGGAGGCGGKGGGGGMGGGASVALASLQATVRIDASSLSTSNAGNGGNGVAGQPGQSPGGTGGNRTGTSCLGGNGGAGAPGAPGGGGAGGVSVGVLYKGPQPTLDGATTSNIKIGAKGNPGAGPGNPGIDGLSAPTLEVK